MKLKNFNPADGSFESIVNDDGSPAIRFYQLGNSGSHLQIVTGAVGSVNLDAKTFESKGDVDIGLWPQNNGGFYIQSEIHPNWLKIWPSERGSDIRVLTGGEPYTQEVGMTFSFQGGTHTRLNRLK
jgi:hypothetical protein